MALTAEPPTRRADAGLFGPGSAAWRIDREVLLISGGAAAVLLQLAHPAVAAGVAQHSNFRGDPFGRLARTANASYGVVFGTRRRAERVIAQINAIHATVNGIVPETGAPYDARDPDLLLWVHETLIDSALRIYERFVAPIPPPAAEAYHAEARQVVVRLGVPPERVPRTLADMRADMRRRMETGEIRVSPTALDLRHGVLYPTRFPPRWVWDLAHLPSLSILPPEIRRGYRMAWGPGHERTVAGLAALSRRLLPLVPAPLRYVPHARSAERRAAGPAGTEPHGALGIISTPAP